jgi:hypothetical protein
VRRSFQVVLSASFWNSSTAWSFQNRKHRPLRAHHNALERDLVVDGVVGHRRFELAAARSRLQALCAERLVRAADTGVEFRGDVRAVRALWSSSCSFACFLAHLPRAPSIARGDDPAAARGAAPMIPPALAQR